MLAHAPDPYEARPARLGAARESVTMNPSPPIIEIHGDDVTVEASYLAAQFDLSVDRLRAEMRRGIIYSVVERGMGEDAGRLRLTFRYRARTWTVVVQRDGTLSEAPWSQVFGSRPRGPIKLAGRSAPHPTRRFNGVVSNDAKGAMS